MMSVPAINSVMPPSGSQSSKISTSPTANPSVSPIGLSVSPKLSVIPPPQLPSSPSKQPIGVNHSSVPLSLVYENKVIGSQTQSKTTEKPKDLSPAKPTANGVEVSTNKTTLPTTQAQPSSAVSPVTKPGETSVDQPNANHSEERISSTNKSSVESHDTARNLTSAPQNASAEKVEESPSQNISKEEEEKSEQKVHNTVKGPNEEVTTEVKPDKKETKSQPQAIKRKKEQKPEEIKQSDSEKKPRRIRSQVLPYQSPLPELTTFINKSLKEKDGSQKNSEEKLIVFYKNEFLAVRNAEDGFYLCQTLQNVYRTSHRIRIRWLSQDKESTSDDGDIYTPDFYDLADFECILTSVALSKKDKNKYKLRKVELERIENILKRALDVEKGVTEKPSITEEHPDGIDLSLYKDESQLQKPKKTVKRKASSPAKENAKKIKKEESGEAATRRSPRKVKPKSRSKTSKKVIKTSSDKSKPIKRGGKSEPKSLKAMDQLKVSPPNEKARVVAKVLRKVDIVPVKEVSNKKQAKSKTAKRTQEISKTQKKKFIKSAKKANQKETVKEEPAQSHRDRRQGKNKYSNYKSKRN